MPAADLDRLRARIAALEGRPVKVLAGPAAAIGVDVFAIGVDAIDEILPGGGLTSGDLHQVSGGDASPAATAFAAILGARLLGRDSRPLLWIAAAADHPHPPALAALGLPPERLVMVRPHRTAQMLWALEEALRSPAVVGVIGQIRAVTPVEARRLHLAARESGGTAIIMTDGPALACAGTRWRVHSAASTAPPGGGVGAARWRLELLRCRGKGCGDDGIVAAWDVEWHEQTHRLCLAAPPADRTVAPVRRRAAG